MINSKGKVIIFTAPSGAGKTTVVQHLLKTYPELGFSISATTRPKRKHEKTGVDYYFMEAEQFQKKIAANEFLEWEEVYPGKFYGTLKSEVQRIWAQNKHIIFDVDVKGATSIKSYFKDEALAVFIKPPSLNVLIDRLTNRGTENAEALKQRIEHVKNELTYEDRFDKVLVNDILEVTLKEAEFIVEDFLKWNAKYGNDDYQWDSNFG
ncbi:MAG: guanylate kinase [Saprospiraceae bacterium]|nr:guanylate kinase [Saprospiraceae bacterium]